MESISDCQPLISFCMSTYKRPDFLSIQLQNILKQTYQNFEVIVSDNDTDKSARSVAESFQDNRIKYFANKENIGMIKSFNKSIERSSGEFVIMITDDDPFYSDSLQILVNLNKEYPNYGVYAGCGDWIIDNKKASNTQKLDIGIHTKLAHQLLQNEIREIKAENFVQEYIEGILSKAFLLWSCAMVKREVLLKVDGVPNYGSELLGDHAYMMAISSQKGMVFINKSLGGQLVHGANFGYDFYKVVNKYINTPTLFFEYLKQKLADKKEWVTNEPLLWNYIGRSWVEYSLMLFHSLKDSTKTRKDFFKVFNQVFSNKKIKKWKYKFYMKAYCKPVFNLLLNIKKVLKG